METLNQKEEMKEKKSLKDRPWPLGQQEADKDPLDEKIKKGKIRIYNGPK